LGLRLGLGLRLNRAVLWLLRAEIRSGLRLRLDRARLLGLNRARVGLDGANLRLVGPVVRLDGANLRLVGAVIGLYGPDLGLVGPVVGLYGPDLRLVGPVVRLDGPYSRLVGADWLCLGPLYLGPVVWFAGSESGLAWARLGLAGTVSRIWPRKTWLGGDGPGSCDQGWAAPVHVVELLAVLLGFALMLELGRHGRNSRSAHGFDFGWPWPIGDAASASVVGDAGVVIDDDGAVIDVGDAGDIDTVHRAVVVEVVASPITAVVADAGVAEAVVDAAVKADVQAPEAAMEAPAVAVPAPVARGPEGAVIRRSAPCAGDPVVARGSPAPVAGGPEVVGLGGFRLLIDGQGRGRFVGVFDGRGFAFFVELLGGLCVLIGLVLIGWRRRSGLLRRILLGGILRDALLGLGLVANSEYSRPGRGGGGRLGLAILGLAILGLAVVDWRHVGVGGIGA
jgi:hypothetical protein